MQQILERVYLGNTLKDYLTSLLFLIILTLILKILNYFVLKRFSAFVAKTDTTIDDYLVKIFESRILPLFYFGVFYAAVTRLTLDPALEKIINFIALALLAFFGASCISSALIYTFKQYCEKNCKKNEMDYVLRLVTKLIQVIVWGIFIVLLLDNFIEIDALIAGLGIGGIAIAFAAQAILSDIFSYFSIFLDRPFEIGDFITVDTFSGTVEHIGLKTTRLRSLSGEQLIFSNGDLTTSRVRNYKRMVSRRILFTIKVPPDTDLSLLKEIPELIRNIILEQNAVTFDRAHFAGYGDFSLDFEAVYYINSNEYNKYMDIQQAVNYRLKEEFERRGIKFAYPTQALLNKQAEETQDS
ncbi:MAG: mechanosensitive ion channel family protein [Clostridia bacterium]|nr:mechanosensitive ion channel family protein [Clostridia bacterium]